MEYTCPKCQQSFLLPDHAAQSVVMCPQCSSQVKLADLETKI